MLSFKSLSEKKTKIKINPKKEDITEGSGDDVDLKKNHGDDCDCMKCESKRRKEDIDEAKVDKLLPDHKRSGKRLERYGNPHGSLALGGGIQRDRRADHAERRGKKTKGVKEGYDDSKISMRFGDGPEAQKKRKEKLEKKRGMKLDDHPQFKHLKGKK